jgi:hypothetical protein
MFLSQVIISVLKYTPLRITPNFFIVSLAAADLGPISRNFISPEKFSDKIYFRITDKI